jgi:hypothetical protein
MTEPSDQIWAYLHDELAPEEKVRFEQELQNNPELLDALDACRETHGEMEHTLPLLDEDEITDDQLEEQLIAEWEAEHPEYAEAPAQKQNRKILRFTLPLAAAAAAMVLLSLSLQTGPVHWQRTVYGTGPQLRGQLGAQPHYTRAELKQTTRDLQETIESRLTELPEPWKLKVHIQELAEGALAVEISGYPHADSNRLLLWTENFQNLKTFHSSIPVLGKQVADDLAGQHGQ